MKRKFAPALAALLGLGALFAPSAQANDDFTYIYAIFSSDGEGRALDDIRGTTTLVNPFSPFVNFAQAGTGLEPFFDIERLKGFTAPSTTFSMADSPDEGKKTRWYFGDSWVSEGYKTATPSNYLDPPGDTTDITVEVTRCSVDWTDDGDGTFSCGGIQGQTYRLLGDPLPPDSGGSSFISGGSGGEPALQQFGKPASGTCEEAASEGLNWSGAPSGGWGESWAQWVNEGNGGFVCTRTIYWDNSTGTWAVS